MMRIMNVERGDTL